MPLLSLSQIRFLRSLTLIGLLSIGMSWASCAAGAQMTPVAPVESMPVPSAPPASQQSKTSATKSSSETTPATPLDNVRYGYIIHQSVDSGGHVVARSGSGAMYDTLVNTQTGPRILDFSLNMLRTKPRQATFFDRLSAGGFGYGGEPNSVSTLNFYKGKLYDFRGSFRRDRQYFDYNLLANPLTPPASVPYLPILDSPHRFNTVRRMTDLNLTLEPLSRFSARISYAHNIHEGPSYSTVHEGAEALLTQFWRNGTDVWNAGLDWKPGKQTTISFDEFVLHYKGDTRWQLSGLDNVLSNGTPVALGIDVSSNWASPCAKPFYPDGTVNPACSSFLSYSRSAPTRTIAPSEQLRFQTASIPHFTVNGRALYSAATSNLNNYIETFNGLDTRAGLRQSLVIGNARVRRLNVNADVSITWQIRPKLAAVNLFDFWNFRMPGTNLFTETDYAGHSLLLPPGPAATTTTADYRFLNQKTKTNTFLLVWDATAQARFTAGVRYRSRIITNDAGDFIPIHEDWLLVGGAFRPTPLLRVNLNVEAMYADNSFTRISPRQMQHYIVRTTYKPHLWLLLDGTINIREGRDNVQTVNHLEHNRDFSFGASISPKEKWSLDLNYSYNDVFSSTLECYASIPAPPNAITAPDVCLAAGTPFASTGYYDAPAQFGSVGLTLDPGKRIHLRGGYRISEVDGSSDSINIRQVPGSLQSQFHTPYFKLAIDLAPNWSWKGDYNYYGYGEGGPAGPTLPRSFHGNVVTLAVNYAF